MKGNKVNHFQYHKIELKYWVQIVNWSRQINPLSWKNIHRLMFVHFFSRLDGKTFLAVLCTVEIWITFMDCIDFGCLLYSRFKFAAVIKFVRFYPVDFFLRYNLWIKFVKRSINFCCKFIFSTLQRKPLRAKL